MDNEDNIKTPNQLKKEKMKRKKLIKTKKGKKAKKNMKFSERRSKAEKWLKTYDGDNLLKAYRKKFAVDRLNAIKELQLLGLTFSDETIAREHSAAEAHKQSIKNRKLKIEMAKLVKNNPVDLYSDSDDIFFFIAGYTSGGAPYGVTWEEMGLNAYESLDEE